MLRFAFRNLLTRPLRSSLALCGLTVAIMGMVGLFSVAEGIQAMVSDTFEQIPGLLLMQPGAPIPLFSRIPAEWGDEVRRLPGVHVVHPEIWTRAQLIEGKATISPPRFLFGSDLVMAAQLRHSVYRQSIVAGRFLTPADRGTDHCLISRQIADEFKKQVGDTLRVDGNTLTIVGIYHCGSLLLDVAIILDIDRVRTMGRVGSDSVCSFYVEPEAGADVDAVRNEIKTLFRGRSLGAWQPSSVLGTELLGGGNQNPIVGLFSALNRALGGHSPTRPPNPNRPDDDPAKSNSSSGDQQRGSQSHKESTAAATPENSRAGSRTPSAKVQNGKDEEELPVEIRGADEWGEQFKRFSADLDVFLLIMTSIGVTIAVLGIINTMLMSVTERFIEFGVLKANGWTNGDVLKLITFESALLGFSGGVLGAALGWGGTLAINANWPTRVHLYASPGLLVFGLCFSTAIGILAGLYPAYWASRMLPMDAIRRG